MYNNIFARALTWCGEQDNVRAAVLTSSRARNDGTADRLSDYDLELYVRDLGPFAGGDRWFEDFGEVLVRWPLLPESTSSEGWITRLVQYRDGTRIDFQITDGPLAYQESFDAGYRVLLDKDGGGVTLGPARSDRLLTGKPSEREYAERVNAFFWDILYVPKSLARDELFHARYMLDHVVRYSCLLPMIEWYIGYREDWKTGTNKAGRWIKPHLPGDIWEMCEATFAGAGAEENRRALDAMVDLFTGLAREVGAGLGYPYPEGRERGVRLLLNKWMTPV